MCLKRCDGLLSFLFQTAVPRVFVFTCVPLLFTCFVYQIEADYKQWLRGEGAEIEKQAQKDLVRI